MSHIYVYQKGLQPDVSLLYKESFTAWMVVIFGRIGGLCVWYYVK